MKLQFLYFIIISITALFACNSSGSKDKKIAKVYGKTLYESEIEYNAWDVIDAQDSVSIKNLYIEHWIQNQLLLRNAKISSDDKKLLNELTENYKNSLIIDFFKNKIISEKLDSVVSDQEMKEYFEQVKNNFKLEETVLNAKYIKIIADKHTINKIKQLWKSGNYKGITDFIHLNQNESALTNDFWITKSDLGKIVPKALLQESSKYESQKNINGTEYFLKVSNSKHKNEIIPFPLLKKEIHELILKKRKSDLLDSFITDLYKQETKKNNVKIYD